jgi:hypothetical protein
MKDLEKDSEFETPPVVLENSGGLLSNTPWWMISVGVHLVLLLGATLIAIERSFAIETDPTQIIVQAPTKDLITQIERSDGKTESNGAPQEKPVDTPSLEPAIFFPEAKVSDHNESADGEDFHEMKGDSKDFLTYSKGEAGGFRGRQLGKTQGVYDTLGVGIGGGGGGRYGGRKGGRENLRAEGPGPTKTTEGSLMLALQWLAHHQGADGGWGASSFEQQCSGARCGGAGDSSYDTGVTGLSILAFLGAGFSPLSKDEFRDPLDPSRTIRPGEVVKRGLQWMLSHQDPEGCVGERGTKYMYNHAIAALALSEAYGMTASNALRDPAQKAIDFLIAAQNPGKGWRYSTKCGDNDSSVTGWGVMALKSAELSDLPFPKTAYDGAINWLNEATSKDGYYRVGYNAKDTGKVYVPGHNETWDDHPALSAVSVMSRIFINKNKREPALTAVTLLASDLPEWKQNKVDFYYWYYASLALFQYDGPDGPMWRKWNEPMKNAIVPHQKGRADGCRRGSWEPQEDRWGFEGGRVYAAAINALTLEVYYRYENVFGVSKKK